MRMERKRKALCPLHQEEEKEEEWNEVTKLFRAGMPLRKHRLHFRVHSSCFTACAAVDWLHELLRNNSNFGPDVTRQQTVQLLKKFLKNHVIEDVKGRWGTEELEDDGHIYRFPPSSPLKPLPCTPVGRKNFPHKDKEGFFKFRNSKKFDKETLENVDPSQQEQEVNGEAGTFEVHRRELTNDDVLEVWRDITLTHLQKILGVTALEDVLDLRHVNPQNIVYNMTTVNKHGVVTLEDKTDDIPPWVLSAMKCLASWPKTDSNHPSYPGFERDVFKTVSDYFNSLSQPLLTFEFYELFINVLGLLQPQLERVAVEALQLCCLLLPPSQRRKLQLLLRMMSRMSQNVDMPRLHQAIGTRTLMVHTFSSCVLSCAEEVDLDELLATRLVSFLLDHHSDILSVPLYLHHAVTDHLHYLHTVQIPYPGAGVPRAAGGVLVPQHAFCRQISSQEFEQQRLTVSQTAIAELLDLLLCDSSLAGKERRKKLRQFQKQYPDIFSRRFPSPESQAEVLDNKPRIKPPLLLSRKSKKNIRT